jgi:L,D-peptidoglycan transpeptidase YkuD (ErfK/YbiS/YcfS/YnhG family)
MKKLAKLPHFVAPMPPTDSPLQSSRQLILSIAPAWESTTATLRRFQRQSLDSAWQPVGDTIKVNVGRSGLAWGLGLHGAIGAEGPVKREGDGCAPAGIFAITELFGDAKQESALAKFARLPYRIATRDLKCIDDPASRHYNRMVDQGDVREIDWRSHEEMLRSDERYAIGAVVAHNSPQPVPGAGSCIFIHVWQREGVPTAGCTAGSFADIADLCLWLDRQSSPLLVQLPLSEYARFKDSWALPSFAA